MPTPEHTAATLPATPRCLFHAIIIEKSSSFSISSFALSIAIRYAELPSAIATFVFHRLIIHRLPFVTAIT